MASRELDDNPIFLRVGNTYLSAVDELVWIPFVALLVPGWFLVAMLLPGAVGQTFVDATLWWMFLLNGDTSLLVWASLVGDLVGLLLAYALYLRAYQRVGEAVLGLLR